MPSARSEAELVSSLRALVRDNAERMFGATGDELRLEQISLSRPLHRSQTRYHRTLTVRYSNAGETREQRIWLKFLKGVRALYDIHAAVWDQTHHVCDLFPRPYFHGEWSGGELIGMELVDGASLRGLFLRRAFTQRPAALSAVFTSLGRGLRAFHDSTEPAGFRSMSDLEENVRRVVTDTDQLRRDERTRLLDHIDAAVRAGGSATRLPLIPIHHDCTLRNVVVRHGGAPCLVDLDSMRAPWKSRWFDVTVFLTNVESQVKYAPLGNARAVASAWHGFWNGYAGAELPDGMSLEQVRALLYLVKLEYVFNGPWRPLFEVYTGLLASRYLTRLKTSVLEGEHLIFASRAP